MDRRKTLAIVAASLITLSMTFMFKFGGEPKIMLGFFAERIENYTQLLENLKTEDNSAAFKEKLLDYNENFLTWLEENAMDLTENEFWSLMENLENHNASLDELLENLVNKPIQYNTKMIDFPGYLYVPNNNTEVVDNFYFSGISYGSSISGIAVGLINTYSSQTGAKWLVALSWDNKLNWTDWKNVPISSTSPPGENISVGGMTDDWGHEWTAKEIRDNFWLRLKAVKNLYIDAVAVTVYYSDWNEIGQLIENIKTHKEQVENTIYFRFEQYWRKWSVIDNWEARVNAPIPPPEPVVPQEFEARAELGFMVDSYNRLIVPLSWNPVPLAKYYEFQWSTDQEFRTESLTTEESRIVLTLPMGIYYWRVRAFVGEQFGPWCETYKLTVITPAKEEVFVFDVFPFVLLVLPITMIAIMLLLKEKLK